MEIPQRTAPNRTKTCISNHNRSLDLLSSNDILACSLACMEAVRCMGTHAARSVGKEYHRKSVAISAVNVSAEQALPSTLWLPDAKSQRQPHDGRWGHACA